MNPGPSATLALYCLARGGRGKRLGRERGRDGLSGGSLYRLDLGTQQWDPVVFFSSSQRENRNPPVTADGRNKEQGKAEVATFFRSSHSSPNSKRPSESPQCPGGHLQNQEISRGNTAAPPSRRDPKPGKGLPSGSEPCGQPNSLPSQKLARPLEGMGHRQGEQKGAQASPIARPGPGRG